MKCIHKMQADKTYLSSSPHQIEKGDADIVRGLIKHTTLHQHTTPSTPFGGFRTVPQCMDATNFGAVVHILNNLTRETSDTASKTPPEEREE